MRLLQSKVNENKLNVKAILTDSPISFSFYTNMKIENIRCCLPLNTDNAPVLFPLDQIWILTRMNIACHIKPVVFAYLIIYAPIFVLAERGGKATILKKTPC